MQRRADLVVTRVRHPLKFRMLQVARVEKRTPHLVRITLKGEDLHDFESASFDDHAKVFFPEDVDGKPVMPSAGPDGIVYPPGQPRPAARDYTPRRFDRAARELDLEFALHDAGPATAWAAQARVGQYLGVGGPRGSLVIPKEFDWHLLVGDDTALPAIARRLEELPAGVRALAVLDVVDPSARIRFETAAELHEVWLFRSAAGASETPMLDAVRSLALPSGEGYVWAAGEGGAIRAVRQHLTAERGIDKSRIRAAAYWRLGSAGVHETIDD